MQETIEQQQDELVCRSKAEMKEAEPAVKLVLMVILLFGVFWGFLGSAVLRSVQCRASPRCGRRPEPPTGANRYGELD